MVHFWSLKASCQYMPMFYGRECLHEVYTNVHKRGFFKIFLLKDIYIFIQPSMHSFDQKVKTFKMSFLFLFQIDAILLNLTLIIIIYYILHFTFTFMHLADAFIQSDLQCIQVIHSFLSVHVFPGNRTHNLCAANAMLYHWATGTHILWIYYTYTIFIYYK